MTASERVVDAVRAALRSESRVNLARHPLDLAFAAADGLLTIEGEVADVAAKKLALERAAAIPEVTGIVDRLRVAPAQRMADGEIRELVTDALLQEPAFAGCGLGVAVKGRLDILRDLPEASGRIDVEVADGVVTLNGRVPGLGHKRLAGVLAWWVPGSRDVINGLAVEPPEDDNDEEIADAVRLALEKDPFVNAGQIRVGARDAVVTLAGLVPTPSERDMAEFDAWYIFAVDRVVNRIEVKA